MLMNQVDMSVLDNLGITKDVLLSNNYDKMFANCKFKELDLSWMDTSHVESMVGMFYGCKDLEYLDISGVDTSKVTNMYNMFGDCPKLRTVILGDKFSFKGAGMEDDSRWAVLPQPPLYAARTKWQRSDGAYGPWWPKLLSIKYKPEMAGKWILVSTGEIF